MRQVNILLLCTELAGYEKPIGETFGYNYDSKIFVPGGALALGFYDTSATNNGDYGVGTPIDIRRTLSRGLSNALALLSADGPINVRRADYVFDSPCIAGERRYKSRVPPRLGIHEQAPITFRDLLQDDKDRRSYNKRHQLSLKRLEMHEHRVAL